MAKCLLLEGASQEFSDALQQLVQAYLVDLAQSKTSVRKAAWHNIAGTRSRTPIRSRKQPVSVPRVQQCHNIGTPPLTPRGDPTPSPPMSPKKPLEDEISVSSVEEYKASVEQILDTKNFPHKACPESMDRQGGTAGACLRQASKQFTHAETTATHASTTAVASTSDNKEEIQKTMASITTIPRSALSEVLGNQSTVASCPARKDSSLSILSFFSRKASPQASTSIRDTDTVGTGAPPRNGSRSKSSLSSMQSNSYFQPQTSPERLDFRDTSRTFSAGPPRQDVSQYSLRRSMRRSIRPRHSSMVVQNGDSLQRGESIIFESQLSDFATQILGRTVTRHKVLEAIHLTIDDPDRNGSLAAAFHVVMPFMILLSVGIVFLQTVHPKPIDDRLLQTIDLFLSVMLILEVTVRIIVFPNIVSFFKRISSSHVFLLIDVAAAIPIGFQMNLGLSDAYHSEDDFGADHFLLFSVVSFLRLLKMLRYIPNFHLLSHSTILLVEALPSMLFVKSAIMFFFASLLAWCEPPESIPSVAFGLQIAITTMTTVGHDWKPTCLSGHIVYALLVLVSVMYMAMPLGIIGHIFTHVWQDRDRILLMKKTRTRLAQWGYTAEDIPVLFSRFDHHHSGELDIFAFREMVQTMNIGFDERRTDELFLQFDVDNSGTIDAAEFVRHLFPRTFHRLFYGHVEDESAILSKSPNNSRPLEGMSYAITSTREERESNLAARFRSYAGEVLSPVQESPNNSRPLEAALSPAQEDIRPRSSPLSRSQNLDEGVRVRVVKEGTSKGKCGIVIGKPSLGFLNVAMDGPSQQTLTFLVTDLEHAPADTESKE